MASKNSPMCCYFQLQYKEITEIRTRMNNIHKTSGYNDISRHWCQNHYRWINCHDECQKKLGYRWIWLYLTERNCHPCQLAYWVLILCKGSVHIHTYLSRLTALSIVLQHFWSRIDVCRKPHLFHIYHESPVYVLFLDILHERLVNPLRSSDTYVGR